MWFLAAIFVASLVLSLVLAPKPKIENAKAGRLNDFRFPRADYGDPVPRVYGTVKIKSPNTIWSGDFNAKAITKKIKTGLFSSKRQTLGYQYYLGFDLAVCLGPNFTFRRIWAGKDELWNGCLRTAENIINVNLPELFGGKDKNGGFVGQIALYSGTFDQSRDTYLASKVDPDVPAYVGIAHMVFRHCWIGNSTQMQPIYIEGSCFSNSLGIPDSKSIMPNGLDINPIEILCDLIVNEWANLGVDANKINMDQWREIAVRIYDENNGMSLLVANQSDGGTIAKEILSQINGVLFEDPASGLFELVLVRNDYVIADLPVLGPDEIESVSNFTKMLWSETYNRVRVNFIDREQDFKEDVPALAEDFANIRFQKRQRTQSFEFPGCYRADLGNELAARELTNVNVPLYSSEIAINRVAAGLRPGSVFVFRWPEYGIEQMIVRIRKFGLGTLGDGTLRASIVQDLFSVNATVIAPPTGTPYVAPDYSPQAIEDYTAFELPYFLAYNSGLEVRENESRVAIFANKPGPYSLRYNVFINDAEVLESAPYSNSATLEEPIGQFDGFEDGVLPTLTIGNIVQATEEFPLDNSNARLGHGLFVSNGEMFVYELFEDNNDGTFTLRNVHRALFDTAYTEHEAGNRLYLFDGQEGFLDDALPIGEFAPFRLQDVTGTGAYPLATADAHDLVPTGRATLPLPADGLAIGGARSADTVLAGGAVGVLTWNARNAMVDPTKINFELDEAEAAPAQTYELKIERDGEVLATFANIATPYDLQVDAAWSGKVLLKLTTLSGDLQSYQPALYPLTVGSPLEIDGEIVTFDGDTIEF